MAHSTRYSMSRTKRIVMTQTFAKERETFKGEKEYDVSEAEADQFIRAGIAVEVEPEKPDAEPTATKKKVK